MSISSDTALVLFSGGQDSTVCLAWALSRFARVETVGFDYGQRHRTELEARPRILEKLKPGCRAPPQPLGEDHFPPLFPLTAIAGTASTDPVRIEMHAYCVP